MRNGKLHLPPKPSAPRLRHFDDQGAGKIHPNPPEAVANLRAHIKSNKPPPPYPTLEDVMTDEVKAAIAIAEKGDNRRNLKAIFTDDVLSYLYHHHHLEGDRTYGWIATHNEFIEIAYSTFCAFMKKAGFKAMTNQKVKQGHPWRTGAGEKLEEALTATQKPAPQFIAPPSQANPVMGKVSALKRLADELRALGCVVSVNVSFTLEL